MSFLPILESVAPTLIGGLVSGGLGAANSASQAGLQASAMASQQQLNWQSTLFDEAMDQQAENMREINTLRDVDMQQRKADDGIVKKFIESIGT